MNEAMEYRGVESDAEVAAYARVLSHSFGRSEADSQTWISKCDRSSIRVMKCGGDVSAGLILFEKGQFWGGRSVPMVGVGAVGVMPESRGRSLATRMMVEALREMRGKGFALSALYPATQKLYRSVGYEQAGHRWEARVPLGKIDVRERSLEVRAMTEMDIGAVRSIYAQAARAHAGNLDRIGINWDRIERPPPTRTEAARGFVVVEPGSRSVVGYVYLSQTMVEGGKHDVQVQDMAAATPGAARRLWAFLAGYATMGVDAVWHTGPMHPMLMLLSEQPYRLRFMHHWMIRVVDVEKALTARGYSAGVDTSFMLSVRDEVLPENTGVYRIRVRESKAEVTREAGVQSDRIDIVRVDACGLACLYSGTTLGQVGIVEGTAEAIGRAEGAFAGPTPWMTDMF